jgi:hypothetical protein
LFPGQRLAQSILIDGHSEGSLMAKSRRRTRKKRTKKVVVRLLFGNILQQLLIRCIVGQVISIDVLPDDVFLSIFGFCVNRDLVEDRFLYSKPMKKETEAWQPLVHVCRRWRSVVFGSPRHLDLRLVCTTGTPVMDTLDVWPALPLLIWDEDYPRESLDNIIPALERSDRVCQINLSIPPSQLEKISLAMQEPFPELSGLELASYETVTVLPDSFLGGSAPRLRSLWLQGIPFPGLPNLLLSATYLVKIHLSGIPHSGYISPEAMATALSTLTSLESFWLKFASPRSCPDPASQRPPPMTRSVLPVLTSLRFKGVSEYLDDLVACIDAPRLFSLYITFFNDIVFDTPQLVQFISRTPTLKALEQARVAFKLGTAEVNLRVKSGYEVLNVEVRCRELDWQISSLEQVCTSSLPPLFALEDLYIYEDPVWQSDWKDNIDNTLWLGLLHPFTAVKNLYISEEFARRIVPALQELVGGDTTVLPVLQDIFVEGLQRSVPVQEATGKLVAARKVTTHPITVTNWEREKDEG